MSFTSSLDMAVIAYNSLHSGVLTEMLLFNKGHYSDEHNLPSLIRGSAAAVKCINSRLDTLITNTSNFHSTKACQNGTCGACFLFAAAKEVRGRGGEIEIISIRTQKALDQFAIFGVNFCWRYRIFLEFVQTTLKPMKWTLHCLKINYVSTSYHKIFNITFLMRTFNI